ncbi:MAG: bifunctional nuclease domain-containing protein [Myxococcales bacterium]
MTAQRIVRVGEDQTIVVLAEKHGARRLAIPVTHAEAALIQGALAGGRGLGAATVEALGGRVLRASIDNALSLRDFRAHLYVGAGTREIALEASAGEALSVALQAGASIVADRALLEEAGVSPDDLRGKRARNLRPESAPAPVQDI